MAALRVLAFLLVAVCVVSPHAIAQTQAPPQAQGPTRNSFANPAEYDNYMAALNTKDAARRAQAMEVFIAWYPNSVLRVEAHEQGIAAYQASNQPAKADGLGQKLLQIDPDNLRALANRAYLGRLKAQTGDATALPQAVAAAERGLVVMPKWQKPVLLDDAGFAKVKEQLSAVFNGVLGFAALQAKDYDKARTFYREAVAGDPADLQNVYQLAVSQLEGQPVDALGFWYGARAIAIAKAANNAAAAQDIDRYVRSRYRVYRGSEEGWDDIVKRLVAGEAAPPETFKKSIPRQLTPPEQALQLLEDNDPAKLPYADWILVLRHRDANAANKAAADKVWKAIGDRQQGSTRMKVPMKVISATPDRIEGAITDAARNGNIVEIEVAMARPLSPLPAVGSTIAFLGTLSDYRPHPFLFKLTRGELAPEFLPVAGGTCADPRPQMCTRDYRPACGTKRDGSRRTYGNACTACSDAEVVTQAAGACP
jgi:tetratricopeptide (TPR) repeat protein